MKIAVTAANGRLGTAVIRELVKRSRAADVVAVARDPSRVSVADVERRAGDYSSIADMQAALAGVDAVLLISAPVAGGGDRLKLHANVIRAAQQAGVRKLVYTSVIGNELAAGTGFAPFYEVNVATEQLVRDSGLVWAIARNGLYLDLDLKHIRHAAAHGGVYRNNGGSGRCGYISIAELAVGLVGMLTSERCDGMTVNLFGELHTQAELVAFASQVFGLDVRYEPISLQENIARFMADPQIAARGEAVARMLSGCFECMDKGAYEVVSHFERAAGRPAKPIPQQLAELDSTG